MAVGPVVTLKNRTSRVLTCMKDGREYRFKPGLNHVTLDVVRFARAQNPLMGTEDPKAPLSDVMSPYYESLISVVAEDGQPQTQDLSDISDDVLAAAPKERINRALLDPVAQTAQEADAPFPRRRVGVEDPTIGMLDPGSFGGRD